jgi:type VI secretion system ImpB/VipA family protein
MALTVSFGRLNSTQSVGTDAPKDDTPFRVAVLGDFSGRGAKGEVDDAEAIGRRRARKVDRGTLEDLMAKVKPELSLPVGSKGLPETLTFRSLDDFHPDGLVGRVAAFQDCFDRDEKVELLNKILHDPEFQGLESAWRGLDWLLQAASGQKRVEIKVVDLSAEELRKDVDGAEQLEATGLYQILVDQPSQRGELDPWTLLVSLHSFAPTAADASLLGRIALVARQSTAPWVAAADPLVLAPKFAPSDEDAEAWTALRKLPESCMLGLAAPRFLLRPPYGENTRSIDAFEYEESTNKVGWPHYLWGNPALACACALIRSFAKDNWAMTAGTNLDLPGMAMHVVRDEDDDTVSVLAEAWLSKPGAENLLNLGLMPLLSVRGRDQMSFLGIHALSAPPKGERTSPLLGRWGQKGNIQLPKTGAAPSPQSAPAAASPAAEPAADESEMDPELAALMAEINAPAAAEPEPEPEPEMDPELAALLADLEAPAEPAPPVVEAEPEPEPELDPELAALLADLEAPAEPAPPVVEAEPEPEPEPEPEMDPELAALMADLEAPDEPAPPVAEAEPEMDPELAALMAELEAPAENEPAPAEAAEEMDPELAALLADLEGDGSSPVS